MIIELEQEECIKNKRCIYCKSRFTSDESPTNPNFFHCPNFCMRVWYSYQNHLPTNIWAGLRVYLNDNVCIRYYKDSSDLEIRTRGGVVTYMLPELEHFNIFSYSIVDLSNKIDRLIFLVDL